jgi:hypothetical protein
MKIIALFIFCIFLIISNNGSASEYVLTYQPFISNYGIAIPLNNKKACQNMVEEQNKINKPLLDCHYSCINMNTGKIEEEYTCNSKGCIVYIKKE